MSKQTKALIPVVDESDQLIGYKSTDAIIPQDIYRVSSLWLTNSQGEILLARRAYTKKHHPGKWGPSVAGTVEQGETYESNIIKEANEEIGLCGVPLLPGAKTFHSDEWKYFVQQFSAVVDWPLDKFKRQETEVAELRWFTPVALKQAVTDHPEDFLSGIRRYVASNL